MHQKCIQNPFNIQSKSVKKMSRCTLHGGPFLVQRTTFLVQRATFLRPLDEGRPQGAKKVSAPDAFGSPATSLSGPKVRSYRPGAPKRIQNSGKRHPKINAKNDAEQKIPSVYQKPSKMMPKRGPKSMPNLSSTRRHKITTNQ